MTDDDFLKEFTDEALELLDGIESDLLTLEEQGEALDDELLNKVFRAAHTIKGGSGFFELENMTLLAHKSETVLDLLRTRKIIANDQVTNLLLAAFDQLRDMVNSPDSVSTTDISGIMEGLESVSSSDQTEPGESDRGSHPEESEEVSDPDLPDRTSGSVSESGEGSSDPSESNTIRLADEEESMVNRGPDIQQENGVLCTNGSSGDSSQHPDHLSKPADESLKRTDTPARSKPGNLSDETLRISVGMLENLMNLAGELVLSRNQLRSAVSKDNTHLLNSAEQRINQVTTELQDVIMQTRLQPIGNVFNKFPRVVRDLAKQMGKDVELDIVGKEVALDKTLIEGISDPLMHMVRNAVDHGIETTHERLKAGKSATGTIRIEAKHEAGQVIIEISDDGKGLNGGSIAESAVRKGLITEQQAWEMSEKEKLYLIFHAGLSTAKAVSDISGRGVGMDVVKTNLNRLNGQIEINSEPGSGTSFRIKLPLTLAIIPSLIVLVGTERFAIPQSNIRELISLRKDQDTNQIEYIGNSEVLLLRDTTLPLLRFRDLAGIDSPNTAGAHKNANEIVVVTDGEINFAVEVDWFENTEEVVVKPLSRRLKHLSEYSGATILGDGSVALILDVNGLAAKGRVSHVASEIEQERGLDADEEASELTSFLLFGNGPGEQFAIPLDAVGRIERIQWCDVEYFGGKRSMKYREGLLELFTLDDVANVQAPDREATPVVVVSHTEGKTIGLLGTTPVNVVHLEPNLNTVMHRQTGIRGSMIIEGRTTLLADINEIVQQSTTQPGDLIPGINRTVKEPSDQNGESSISGESEDITALRGAVLLAEDSDFFRSKIKQSITDNGYHVIEAPDGEKAWALLLENLHQIQLVVTDVEMPLLDGLQLTRRIRSDHRTATLPVIAVSSLAADEDIERGIEAGVTEYQIKLDREKLLSSIDSLAEISMA
ncbi:MAG: hybrid sensor histidine kinase/response regulator [Balneolaceae bacterium]|nr:MAG: hybrid sensor histidine kinase/response regulator [Balneolaceae bacterium]